jgi:hypothetical protein
LQPARDIWQRDLLPGERILWAGRPAKRARLVARDIFPILFSIVWIGVILPWVGRQLADIIRARDLSGVPGMLPGLAFLGFGLYVSLGRLVLQRYLRRHTWYAVTDQRVLVRTTAGRARFDAISLDALPSLATHQRGDGVGSISFGDLFGFIDIPKVQQVYQIILTERNRRRRITGSFPS